jgi:hypothetical protein
MGRCSGASTATNLQGLAGGEGGVGQLTLGASLAAPGEQETAGLVDACVAGEKHPAGDDAGDRVGAGEQGPRFRR